jgi:3-keto-disaccharide hydrolase
VRCAVCRNAHRIANVPAHGVALPSPLRSRRQTYSRSGRNEIARRAFRGVAAIGRILAARVIVRTTHAPDHRSKKPGDSKQKAIREDNIMQRLSAITMGLLLIGAAVFWHAQDASGQAGWVTLFDGKNLDNWSPIGNANWRLENGVVVADKGNGFLVSKNSYGDFEVKAEFWTDADANSGIFIRCTDPQKVTSKTAYEVNIFDKRPDPSFGTGAIVGVAKAATVLKAADKWNTYEIVAKGPKFTVTLNGTKTVDGIENAEHANGHIALQYGAGVVKFRKVEIRPL